MSEALVISSTTDISGRVENHYLAPTQPSRDALVYIKGPDNGVGSSKPKSSPEPKTNVRSPGQQSAGRLKQELARATKASDPITLAEQRFNRAGVSSVAHKMLQQSAKITNSSVLNVQQLKLQNAGGPAPSSPQVITKARDPNAEFEEKMKRNPGRRKTFGLNVMHVAAIALIPTPFAGAALITDVAVTVAAKAKPKAPIVPIDSSRKFGAQAVAMRPHNTPKPGAKRFMALTA